MYHYRSLFNASFYSVIIYHDGTGIAVEYVIPIDDDSSDSETVEQKIAEIELSSDATTVFLVKIDEGEFWRATPDTEVGCDGDSVLIQGIQTDEVWELFNWGITNEKVKVIQAAYHEVFTLW